MIIKQYPNPFFMKTIEILIEIEKKKDIIERIRIFFRVFLQIGIDLEKERALIQRIQPSLSLLSEYFLFFLFVFEFVFQLSTAYLLTGKHFRFGPILDQITGLDRSRPFFLIANCPFIFWFNCRNTLVFFLIIKIIIKN